MTEKFVHTRKFQSIWKIAYEPYVRRSTQSTLSLFSGYHAQLQSLHFHVNVFIALIKQMRLEFTPLV